MRRTQNQQKKNFVKMDLCGFNNDRFDNNDKSFHLSENFSILNDSLKKEGKQ